MKLIKPKKQKCLEDQNQYLLDCATMSFNSNYHAAIEGNLVCKAALCLILGVSKKRYRRICSQASACVTTSTPQHRQRRGKSTNLLLGWIGFLIQLEIKHTYQTHLPHFLTKRDVYKKMRAEIEQDRNIREVVSLSHFYLIWEKEFKKVEIPAVSYILYQLHVHAFLFIIQTSLFSKCDMCTKFSQERMKFVKNDNNNLHELYVELVG